MRTFFQLLLLGLLTLAFSSCSDHENEDEKTSSSRLLGISCTGEDYSYWESYTYDSEGRIDRVHNPDGWKTFVYQKDTIFCNFDNYQIAYSVKDNKVDNWAYYPDPSPYDKDTPAETFDYKRNRLMSWTEATLPPTEIKWEDGDIVSINDNDIYTYTGLPASYAGYQFSPASFLDNGLYAMGLFGERSKRLPLTHTCYSIDLQQKGGVLKRTLQLFYKETFDYTVKDHHVVSCVKTTEFYDGTVNVYHYTLTWE